MTEVLVVGGGFGGLNVVKQLAGKNSIHVTLLDKRNYHLFQPLLYQVAMAGLSPAEIAYPLRSIFSKNKNVRVLLGELTGVDRKQKIAFTNFGSLSYDYLVLACGARQSYFGNSEWEAHAPGLKTLEQATEVRRRVLSALELAERTEDREKLKELLSFVVIGGGPTGVELAGALGELSRFTLSRDFRRADPKRTRVLLIEAGPRILPSFSPKLSERAKLDLQELGVEVWTSTKVIKVEKNKIYFNSSVLNAHSIIWAAGVEAHPINRELGTECDKQGRLIVKKDLSLPDDPSVFVIGDQASFKEGSRTLPGLAPVAIQQGRFVGTCILREIRGLPRGSFQYHDKGQMATIGRQRAVVETKHSKFGGTLAWFTWLGVHIYYLIGFKNRLFVLMQWAWAYFTYKRGAQLILHKEWRDKAEA